MSLQAQIDALKSQQRRELDLAEQYSEGSAQYRQHLEQFDALQRDRERLIAQRDRTAGPAAGASGTRAANGERPVDRQRATAYHEAGHTVVCRALGLKVYRVTCVFDGENAGLTTHEHASNPRDAGTICAAGRYGARLAGVNVGHEDGGCSADEANLHEVLACYTDLIPEVRRRARELVETHAGAVDAVARALLARGTLTGAEVHALCRQHGL